MYSCSFVSSQSSTQYLIINGSCPVSAGQSEIITSSSSDNLDSYFSFYPAQFAGSSSGLQVSCSALLCRTGDASGYCAGGTCTPQHLGARRKRRDLSSSQLSLADYTNTAFATRGPVVYVLESTSAAGYYKYVAGEWVFTYSKSAGASNTTSASPYSVATTGEQQSATGGASVTAAVAAQGAAVASGLVPTSPSLVPILLSLFTPLIG